MKVPLTRIHLSSFFFFNDTAPPKIYPLSLHDALPIFAQPQSVRHGQRDLADHIAGVRRHNRGAEDLIGPLAHQDPSESALLAIQHGPIHLVELPRSEEHTSELQSRLHLVCRLLLEKKK